MNSTQTPSWKSCRSVPGEGHEPSHREGQAGKHRQAAEDAQRFLAQQPQHGLVADGRIVEVEELEAVGGKHGREAQYRGPGRGEAQGQDLAPFAAAPEQVGQRHEGDEALQAQADGEAPEDAGQHGRAL